MMHYLKLTHDCGCPQLSLVEHVEKATKVQKNIKGWMKGFNSRIVSGATIITWRLCNHLKELDSDVSTCLLSNMASHSQHWNLFDQVYH